MSKIIKDFIGVSLVIIAGLLFMPQSCLAFSKVDWHTKYQQEWKIIDIKKEQITKLKNFGRKHRDGSNLIGKTDGYKSYWSQGSAITPRHLVWSSWTSNDDPVYVIFADRNPPYTIRGVVEGHFQHAPLTYNTKTDEIIVGGNGKWTFISDTTMKVTKTIKRKISDFPYNGKYNAYSHGTKFYDDSWHKVSGLGIKGINHGLTAQQNATYNDHVYKVANDWGCNDWHPGMYPRGQKICWPHHGGTSLIFAFNVKTGELEKTYVILGSVVDEELEAVSFDTNGDMYLSYNEHGVTWYKISNNVLKTEPSQDGGSSGGGSSSGGSDGGSGGDENRQGHTGHDYGGEVSLEPVKEPACTSILDSSLCDKTDGEATIKAILSFVVNTMTVGIGVLGTIGIIHASYIIMTAKDNESKVKDAKIRIVEVVIGLVVWVLFAAIMNLLLPNSQDAASVLGRLLK